MRLNFDSGHARPTYAAGPETYYIGKTYFDGGAVYADGETTAAGTRPLIQITDSARWHEALAG